MFVMTAKLSKPKLFAAGVILVALIAALIMLFSGNTEPAEPLPMGRSHEERAAYLATYGWSIDTQPKETQTVTIPKAEDNKVFARYNELQVNQGFDLKNYGGKEATRYVYEILNYPEASAPVYAGILVYEGKIIGGEITDTSPNGVIHGFRKPENITPTEESASAPTETTALPTTTTESVPTESETTLSTTP